MDYRGISHIEDEPERYELHDAPRYQFELDRRDFFQILGGGIVVLLSVKPGAAQPSRRARRRPGRGGQQAPDEIGAWLHIGEDGVATAFTGKAEVGQNIRTSLAQAVAEELRIPVSSIRMAMADTDRVPYDRGTFGSRTTPSMGAQLRRVAAAARDVLLDLAAEHFQTDRTLLTMSDGRIAKAETKESLSFGELTQGRKLMTSVRAEPALTSPAEWKVAGTSVPKVDGRAFVTGAHKYSCDIQRPNLLHGKILRPAAFEATLKSINLNRAEALPGVTVVRDGDFVGVTAPNEQLASQAIDLIQADWATRPQPSGKELYDHLKRNAREDRRRGRGGPRQSGSIEKGLAAADHQLRTTYTIAYIAHAPLEPRAAVAEWQGGKLTVWTGTQRPFGVRSELAQAFGLSEERIRVIVPDTGSGYGGKHTGEAAVEAARLAKAAGRPVKLVWTREEEFTWAYFRPAGVIDITSGVREDGTITAWEIHNYNSGASSIDTPYQVENRKIEFHASRAPLRQGSYRALAATANHFARESHMDELARTIGMDPLEFRLKNLKNERLRAVLEAAADAFGWGKRQANADSGFGIAGGTEKGSYVATCAEVATDRKNETLRVTRVVAGFECGAIINPEHLKSQVEGAIVMGLGGALFEAIDFADGRILNPYFSDYRVPRFSDMPEIEVVLVNRPDLPSIGAGETPIVGIAPAIHNAILNATGAALHSLPMVPDGLKSPTG